MRKIIVPGYQGSPKGHWQYWLQSVDSNATTVIQDDWDFPSMEKWVNRLQEVIETVDEPVQLVGHSMGCITIAFWAQKFNTDKVDSAVLVAPADSESSYLPKAITGFSGIPRTELPFPSVVVGSHTDPYMRFDRALYFANRWGSNFADAGNAGHINIEAGYNEWPELLTLLNSPIMNYISKPSFLSISRAVSKEAFLTV